MDNRELPVKVLYKGETIEYSTRKQAIEYYKQAKKYSCGEDRERYINILADLLWSNKEIIYDRS